MIYEWNDPATCFNICIQVMTHCANVFKLFDGGFLVSGNHIVSNYFAQMFTDKMADDLSAVVCILDCDVSKDDGEGQCRIFHV